ncbi:MAG: hypothetical protein KBT44_00030 [Bacteroidales bacterium]|nr:hypothetical protein [Candidatus Equibacterium intestinale]
MKKFYAIIAAAAALVACQKQAPAVQETATQTRIISAAFEDTAFKTSLDGTTPVWTVGDKIKLLSATSASEVTVVSGTKPTDGQAVIVLKDGKASGLTICTSLSGTLYAVYPASCCSAASQTDDKLAITIPAAQNGSFAAANICAAKENAGKLVFKNVTAVLHLTQTATTKVDKVTVISEGALDKNKSYASTACCIAGDATVDMSEEKPVAVLAEGQSKKIKVVSADIQTDYYIAIAPDTLMKGTAFGFDNSADRKLGGRNLSADKIVEAGTIYNIGSMDGGTWHDYIEVTDASGKTLKWATMNLGATSSEPGRNSFGDLFSWGNTTGQPNSKITKAFNTGNYSGTAGSKITSAKMWDVTVNDAARFQWGGTWRLPVQTEYTELINSTVSEKIGDSWKNGVYVNGYLFKCKEADESGIFFPAAGYCNMTSSLSSAGQFGDYWTSTWQASGMAYGFDLNASKLNTSTPLAAYSGRSIRAVSE